MGLYLNMLNSKHGHLKFRKQKGITIVELLVSVVIGSIIIGGSIMIYTNSKGSYKTQQALARLQENGRFALEFIANDVRSAGYIGCANIRGNQGVTPTDTASLAANYTQNTFVLGSEKRENKTWVNALTSNSPAMSASDQILPGTDVIEIKRGGACSDFSISPMTSSNSISVHSSNQCQFAANEVLIISDCEKADIVSVASSANGILTLNQTVAENYKEGAQIMRYFQRVYYLAENSEGTPSLFRADNNGSQQEMVEGVSEMKILYGSANANGSVERYVNAEKISDWANVKSLRLSLLLVTEDKVAQQPVGYLFSQEKVTDDQVTDRRLRRAYTATIAVRN